VTEVDRVLRASHAFGVLNTVVPRGVLMPPSEVERLARLASRRLTRARGHARYREARSRLAASCRLLRDPARQRAERDALIAADLRPVTRTLDVSVDVAALADFLAAGGPQLDVVPQHKDGSSYGMTRRRLVERLLSYVRDVA